MGSGATECQTKMFMVKSEPQGPVIDAAKLEFPLNTMVFWAS